MSAILCLGKYAKTPYYSGKVCMNIYSIEEVCYLVARNAYLIDESIENKEFVDWIDTELGLPELARDLYTLLNQKASVSAFVGTILSYTGYLDDGERRDVERILKQNAYLSVYEKKKAKADYLAQTGKYALANSEYDALLHMIPEREQTLQAKILHNMGVISAQLFLFGEAAEKFYQSWELENNEETYLEFLAAKRLDMGEEGYIRYIAEHPEAYEVSLTLEKRIRSIMEAWEQSEKCEQLRKLSACRGDGNIALYYEETARLNESLKQEYRSFFAQ
ncbi:MAG: hypothetical protein PHP50_00980 [Lachnospiraceae bacterium]|nr:hypothetical protein [Lachnospiraceae bacterium]